MALVLMCLLSQPQKRWHVTHQRFDAALFFGVFLHFNLELLSQCPALNVIKQ